MEPVVISEDREHDIAVIDLHLRIGRIRLGIPTGVQLSKFRRHSRVNDWN